MGSSEVVFPMFSISPVAGFLPDHFSNRLKRLDRYQEWEDINDELVGLIKRQELRDRVQKLPTLCVSDATLPTEAHWQRAYCVLTFISQGYLWERGEEGTVDELPQQLAIPWYEVSTRCGLPPVATYAAVVLWNWCLKDESMPPTLDNLKTVFSFSGTRSEEWFYLIPLAMELSAIPGIKATVDCFDAMRKGNTIDVIANLKVVCEVIKNMTTILQKMYDECIPDVFYQVFRKFQAGTKNLKKAFSNGLVFEGVDKDPKSHGGASAGQSSILPVFDILLDVQHSGSAKEFLDLQRWHMPRQHRQFLLYLSQQRSLKEFVMQNMTNKSLLDTYNKCVGDLVHFRSQHIILVSRYIVSPAQKYSTSKGDDNLATRGTGGSDFMIFLKTVRDNTANNHISD